MKNDRKAFNPQKTAKLLGITKEVLFSLMSSLFNSLEKDYYTDISAAIKEKNMASIYASFHSLKGPVSYLSINKICTLCEKACDFSSRNKDVDYESMLMDIKDQFQRLQESLKI